MYQFNDFVERHLPLIVLVVVIIGIVFSVPLTPLCSTTAFLLALLTFANSLGGGFREIANVFLHPLPVIACLVMTHLVMPSLAYSFSSLLLPDDPLYVVGITLNFCLPTAVTSLMWIGFCKANVSVGLSIVLLDTLLSPLVLPLSMKVISGTAVEVETWSLMKDMLFMVAIPALLAMILRQFIGKESASTLKRRLSPFAKIILLIIIMANATRCAPLLRDLDISLAKVMLCMVVLTTVSFLLSFAVGGWLRMRFPDRMTVTINTSLRNGNAGAVLASQYFPAEVIFPLSFLPLYMQLLTSVILKRLMRSKPALTYQDIPSA